MSQNLYQRENGTGIRPQVRLEIEFSPRQKNCDAMIADRAGEQHLVAGTNGSGIDLQSVQGTTDSGGGDVHKVGFAMLDNLGIAAGDCDARFARSVAHGAYLSFENGRGQSCFQNVGDDHGLSFSSGYCQVVDRPVNSKLSDGSSGELQRLHHETICGNGEASAVEIEMGGVAERFRGREKKQRSEKTFDQATASFASGAVGHFDLRLAEPDFRLSCHLGDIQTAV